MENNLSVGEFADAVREALLEFEERWTFFGRRDEIAPAWGYEYSREVWFARFHVFLVTGKTST